MKNIEYMYKDFVIALRLFCKNIPEGLNFDFFMQFRKTTQAEKVLWHLQNYGTITNLQCHSIYGIRHAPSVIRDVRQKLRLEGNKWKIENEIKEGCNRFGEPCRWDVYVLRSCDETQKTNNE